MNEKKTILVVEDEKVQRDLLSARFTQEGFNVLQAENGVKGLELALEKQPDLLIIDIRMPEMTGFSMLKKLRASGDWGTHVPAVFLTNIAMSDDNEEIDVEETGALRYFVKSDTDLNTLVSEIKKLV